MKEKIIEVTEFQRQRLTQLEDGLANVNNIERTMAFTGQSVLFTGPEDEERQIDMDVLKAIKGGLRGVESELIFEYVPDKTTGRDIRVKNEEMQLVTREIISIANAIKNQ